MLLGVVGQSLKPVKFVSTCQRMYSCNNSQQFWKLFANNVVSVCKGLKLSSDKKELSHFWLCKLKLELTSR